MFNKLFNTGGIIVKHKNFTIFSETDVKITFGNIYSDIMDHDVDLLACISHNWQREKEERKERRKREKVNAMIYLRRMLQAGSCVIRSLKLQLTYPLSKAILRRPHVVRRSLKLQHGATWSLTKKKRTITVRF